MIRYKYIPIYIYVHLFILVYYIWLNCNNSPAAIIPGTQIWWIQWIKTAWWLVRRPPVKNHRVSNSWGYDIPN